MLSMGNTAQWWLAMVHRDWCEQTIKLPRLWRSLMVVLKWLFVILLITSYNCTQYYHLEVLSITILYKVLPIYTYPQYLLLYLVSIVIIQLAEQMRILNPRRPWSHDPCLTSCWSCQAQLWVMGKPTAVVASWLWVNINQQIGKLPNSWTGNLGDVNSWGTRWHKVLTYSQLTGITYWPGFGTGLGSWQWSLLQRNLDRPPGPLTCPKWIAHHESGYPSWLQRTRMPLLGTKAWLKVIVNMRKADLPILVCHHW